MFPTRTEVLIVQTTGNREAMSRARHMCMGAQYVRRRESQGEVFTSLSHEIFSALLVIFLSLLVTGWYCGAEERTVSSVSPGLQIHPANPAQAARQMIRSCVILNTVK